MLERVCAFVIAAFIAPPAAADSPVASSAEEYFQQALDSPNRFVPLEEIRDVDRVQMAVTTLALGSPDGVPMTRLPFDPDDLALLKAAQQSERDFGTDLQEELMDPLCAKTNAEPEAVDADTILSAMDAMKARGWSHWTSTWNQLSEHLSPAGRDILASRVDQIALDHLVNWRAVADYDPQGFVQFHWQPMCRSLMERRQLPNDAGRHDEAQAAQRQSMSTPTGQ